MPDCVEHQLIVAGNEPCVEIGGVGEEPVQRRGGRRLIDGRAAGAVAARYPVEKVLPEIGGVRGEDPCAGIGKGDLQRDMPGRVAGCAQHPDPGSDVGVTIEYLPADPRVRPVLGAKTFLEQCFSAACELELGPVDRDRNAGLRQQRDTAGVIEV